MGKRLNLFVRVFVLALLIAASALYFSLKDKSVWLIAAVSIAMAVGLVAIVAASEKVTAMKTGLPLEDELTKKATWKAGYYAFLTGLWLAIGIMAIEMFAVELFGVPELDFRYAFEALIVFPSVAFIGLAWWYKKKGAIE